ncbi:MAG: hypothetical protein AAF438_05615 [Pseudomonadota bacterium]
MNETTRQVIVDHAELFACPRSDQALTKKDGTLYSRGGQVTFPWMGDIPWLFADPDTTLADWRGRLDRAIKQYLHDADGIDEELSGSLPDRQKSRLTRLRDAYRDQANRMSGLMSPLGAQQSATNFYTYLALRTRLPTDQGLNTYYANVHRDWVWGNAENQVASDLISHHAISPFGKTLVMGCGAGRLPYDIHMRHDCPLTIGLDFNPLLLLLADKMARGDTVQLYEFPLAPLDQNNLCVLQDLKAPRPANDKLVFVAGDVLRPPFRPGSFDTIITPWLVDVIDEPFTVFAARINQLLREGGQWINFGSLAFAHAEKAHNLLAEDTLEAVGRAGFETSKESNETIDYMCSPHSRHGRRETVFVFGTTKTEDVPAPTRHASLPNWIVKGDTPVPKLRSFETQSMSSRIYAFMMALVDGQRSIKDMAQLMVEQKLLDPRDAEGTVKTFVIKMYEESQKS